ncbi:MAG: hypothetical protein M1824_004357 [Vezdaea acicularis]|nr:MAG: hypothetical protein M1824_004357 [Vezdaea acicularis]
MYLYINCSSPPAFPSTPQGVDQQQAFSREGTANLVISLVTVILGAVVAWQGRRLRAVLLEAVGLQHRARREGSIEDGELAPDALEGPAECQRAANTESPPSLSRSSIERGFGSEGGGSARVHHARAPYVPVDGVDRVEKLGQLEQEVHIDKVDQVEKVEQVEQEVHIDRVDQAEKVRQVERDVQIDSVDQP